MYYRRRVLNDELVEKVTRPALPVGPAIAVPVSKEEDIVDLLQRHANDFLFGDVAKRALERIESLQARLNLIGEIHEG